MKKHSAEKEKTKVQRVEDTEELVNRSYRLPKSLDDEIKDIATVSRGHLSANDIMVIAVRFGLGHVRMSVIPALVGEGGKK